MKLMPIVLPPIFRLRPVRRWVFRMISQTRINYRKTPLSTGVLHHLHSGDRLPWLKKQDNHGPLVSLDWQLHYYGDVSKEVTKKLDVWCSRCNLELHCYLPAAPIAPGTLCLVRPDGYIGWIGRTTELMELTRYITQWRIA